MVPDNFLSGWEGEFDPLKWIYLNVVFELFARGAGNLNTNFPPKLRTSGYTRSAPMLPAMYVKYLTIFMRHF